jgi:hypothetical protein
VVNKGLWVEYAKNIHIVVFWATVPYSLLNLIPPLEGKHCLHLQDQGDFIVLVVYVKTSFVAQTIKGVNTGMINE